MMQPVVVDMYHGEVMSDIKKVAAAGIKGIIHKATQGTGYVDDKYKKRKAWALENGLLWGAYHFATGQNVTAQVDNFLKAADVDDHTLLALDFEQNFGAGGSMTLAQARQFLQLVRDKTGQRPLLYSGNWIKEKLTKPDTFFNSHRLWLAQYGPKAVMPAGWKNYWLWQYTGDGVGQLPHEIPGIQTKGIDLNVFGGKDLALEWIDKPVS